MKIIRALAIDPGTRKCGLAVVENGETPQTLYREVVSTSAVSEAFPRIHREFAADIVLIGNATNGTALETMVRAALTVTIPIEFVEERLTSEFARARWCRENPPKVLWERLFPGFRTPTGPVDDYAAVILAERYFAGQS